MSGNGFDTVDHRYRGRQLPNAMSVDVEDYFQVSAFASVVPRERWDEMPARLPRNVDRILELFDEHGVKGTFFTLGWVAERFPDTVKRIASEGHEVASHGYEHARVTSLTRDEFATEVEFTRKLLEDLTGMAVVGYRAPSFSIGRDSLWAHEVLAEAGYRYSSSVFPIQHDHYGLPEAPRFPFRTSSDGILEIPMSTLPLLGRNWPCSGGGYFRLMPSAYSEWAVKRINRRDEMPAVFYFHPWELDPGQPRVQGASAKARFRHYLNLDKFESRLKRMLVATRWDRMDRIFLDSA